LPQVLHDGLGHHGKVNRGGPLIDHAPVTSISHRLKLYTAPAVVLPGDCISSYRTTRDENLSGFTLSYDRADVSYPFRVRVPGAGRAGAHHDLARGHYVRVRLL